jgi:acetyl-CoA C-acetyltransferase
MASGIKDKVAIIGMGCSSFGERWDCSAEDLMLEAYEECLADATLDTSDIESAWLGLCYAEHSLGKSAISLSQTLRLANIPVTRVENLCATGSEALRGAAYAVAAGACDIALAMGVEKLKDTGFGGLPGRTMGTFDDLWLPGMSAPGAFAQICNAYANKYDISIDALKEAMAHVSCKSHDNAMLNPKAHLRKAITLEKVINAPMIAYPLGLLDCCGVSDGAACAIVTTPEKAIAMGKAHNLVSIKAMQLSLSNGAEMFYDDWDGSHVMTTRRAAEKAYAEAGIKDPEAELSLIEVHDCFSITELITMEDLGLSAEGKACEDILAGKFDRDGSVPCNTDGGLKCFGHPLGASGLRMVYEVYQQLHQRAGERQLAEASLGLTHNLGGFPNRNVCSISILGHYSSVA